MHLWPNSPLRPGETPGIAIIEGGGSIQEKSV